MSTDTTTEVKLINSDNKAHTIVDIVDCGRVAFELVQLTPPMPVANEEVQASSNERARSGKGGQIRSYTLDENHN
ncbi:hypothetical protein [Parasitella parasitica]|uniref:Uncharacterized protein n=1 Tax=Parasitella parasitica TaxID=35722 RepID=A0A0B7MSR6_9FUNG|nr:hypothetical protein [Parasitella parasitica]